MSCRRLAARLGLAVAAVQGLLEAGQFVPVLRLTQALDVRRAQPLVRRAQETFVSLQKSGSAALPVDKRVWRRNGYQFLKRMDLSYQCIGLIGKGQLELTLADHGHEFDAGQDIFGGSE